jgi:spore coat polysaccharide biosynthesis protein SpsF (cytidylyltransferase family)
MSRKDVVIVLQARMGSSRLPGKVLAPLLGRPILSHCIARLQRSGLRLVVATTTEPEDDAVAAEAWRQGADVLRGSEFDVLARFLMVVDRTNASVIIRATGDNPLVDLEAPSRVLRALGAEKADYVVEIDLPVGAGVEAVRSDALRTAAAEAADPYDREHVTSYVRRNRHRFGVLERSAPVRLRRPDLRLTVDTPSDLDFVRQLLRASEAQPGDLPPLRTLLAAAHRIESPAAPSHTSARLARVSLEVA